jgi:O-antigen/teichoic acid export membrane protein
VASHATSRGLLLRDTADLPELPLTSTPQEPDRNEPARRGPAGHSLLGSSVVVAAGLAVGQVLGYAVNVVGARLLGPEGYSVLGSLLAVLLIGSVVGQAVQAVVARRVALGSSVDDLEHLGTRAAVLVTVAALVLTPVLAAVLHVPWLPLLLVALTTAPLTLIGIAQGVAQGHRRFGVLAGQYAVIALLRTGATLAVLVAHGSITAVMLAGLVGGLLGAVAVARMAGVPLLGVGLVERALAVETARAAHALVAMFVFTSIDVLLARALLEPGEAGRYAAGTIITKVAFWLPQAVTVAVFPSLAASGGRGLRTALALVAGLGGAVVVGAWALGSWAVPLLLGGSYDVVAHSAAVFALAGTMQSVAYLVLYDRLAADDPRAALLVWGGVALLAALVATVGKGSPVAVSWCVVVSAATLAAAGVVLRSRRTDPVPA